MDVGDYAASVLRSLPHVATTLAIDAMDEAIEKPERRADIVHRPYQVTNADDLKFLRTIGQRLVITHHDLISFRNPGYHDGAGAWLEYRRVTRQALAAADAVVFDSAHAAADARAEDLVEPDRALVAPIGVDHRLAEPDADRPATPPAGAGQLAGRPYLLCLGTDYRHKNRVFALQLLEALRERGWDGDLVLAGPRVQNGSSAGEEAMFLATRPDLAAHVMTLPAIADPEKRWLYEHATAAAYPTISEGFGFVPFEAAAFGIPCLFAPVTSLAETLADVEAPIVPWDVAASAERCLELLTGKKAAAAQVKAIRRAAGPLTWAAHARAAGAALRPGRADARPRGGVAGARPDALRRRPRQVRGPVLASAQPDRAARPGPRRSRGQAARAQPAGPGGAGRATVDRPPAERRAAADSPDRRPRPLTSIGSDRWLPPPRHRSRRRTRNAPPRSPQRRPR